MFDLPDNEILPLSKEHVFWTWSAQAKVNPIAIKRAKGVYFWDVDDPVAGTVMRRAGEGWVIVWVHGVGQKLKV